LYPIAGMRKRIKLIFYTVSIVVLGALTMWDVIATRDALVVKNIDASSLGVDQLRDVVLLWNKRDSFASKQQESLATPSAEPIPVDEGPTEEASSSAEPTPPKEL